VNERGLVGSFWPSERQKLLLRTAFAGGEASAEAWHRLRPRLDLDRLELGSFPLLPLVHRQLERLGIEDPYVPRLAGIRRRTWYLNHLQLDALAPALRSLEEAGTAPLVVGGWELPARCYGGHLGLRPVEGLDVLVPPGRVDAAARALADLGFERARDTLRGRDRLVDAEGRTCTLHERLAREFSVPERGVELEDLRDEAIEISLGHTRARALGAADELVRICLVGARTTAPPSVLWVADALALLQAEAAAIDWQRLVRHARRLRATLRLRDALVYVSRELDAVVPGHVIRELEATPARRRERLAHREAGRSRRLVGPSPRTLTRFLHVTADRPLPAALVALPPFLRDELGPRRRARRQAARTSGSPARQSTVEAE
jgi:hypothetical protein